MKRLLFLITATLFTVTASVMAQVIEPEIPVYESIFLTFPALAASVVLVIEGIKKIIPSMGGLITQLVSWLAGVIICFLGAWLELGFLDGLSWYMALFYGIGISLAANGVADTGFLQWLIGLFSPGKVAGKDK